MPTEGCVHVAREQLGCSIAARHSIVCQFIIVKGFCIGGRARALQQSGPPHCDVAQRSQHTGSFNSSSRQNELLPTGELFQTLGASPL